MTDRPFIEIIEAGMIENSLEATERDGHFNLSIDNPWAGDTESGFGYSAHFSMTLDDAKILRDWLAERIELRDSDRSPEGGDSATGSIEDESAGLKGIAPGLSHEGS